MPDVLRVERASFEHQWTEEEFLYCLRQKNCIGMVAEHGRTLEISAFMLYELHKYQVHVLNFAVHPDCRRQGIGRLLVSKLQCKVMSHHRERLVLEVREGNLRAQRFFRSQGMRATAILPGHYQDSGEAAYRMEWGAPPAPPEPGDWFEVPPNRISQYLEER